MHETIPVKLSTVNHVIAPSPWSAVLASSVVLVSAFVEIIFIDYCCSYTSTAATSSIVISVLALFPGSTLQVFFLQKKAGEWSLGTRLISVLAGWASFHLCENTELVIISGYNELQSPSGFLSIIDFVFVPVMSSFLSQILTTIPSFSRSLFYFSFFFFLVFYASAIFELANIYFCGDFFRCQLCSSLIQLPILIFLV